MSNYKKNSKVSTIILWVLIALVTVGLIAMIVVGFVRSQTQNDVTETDAPTIESNEPGTTEPNPPESDIPVIIPGTEQGGDEPEPSDDTTEPGHVSVDVIGANEGNEKKDNPHMDYTFEVYTLDASGNETVVHRDTWSDVVIPGNETNLVYFKWQVPQDSAGTLYWCRGYVNENQAIAEDDLSNNRTEFSKYSVNYEESQTPNTRYESQAPAGYNGNVSVPSEQTGKATWNQWEYVNSSFVLKTYGVQVSSGTPTIRPSDACKTATYSGGKWTMKSGYGISLIYNPVIAFIPGYASPQGTAYTGVQNIFALFPEYGYSTDEGAYRTLEYSNGAYRFFENPDADGNERLHFIPVYVQDGNYVVSVTVTQIWTPAGMIMSVRNSVPITIDGTIYDDFYQG